MLIDESSITGESLAVTKRQGDEVRGGGVVQQGELEAVVTYTGSLRLQYEVHSRSYCHDSQLRRYIALVRRGYFLRLGDCSSSECKATRPHSDLVGEGSKEYGCSSVNLLLGSIPSPLDS